MKKPKTLVRRQIGMELNNTLDGLTVETVENTKDVFHRSHSHYYYAYKLYEPKV